MKNQHKNIGFLASSMLILWMIGTGKNVQAQCFPPDITEAISWIDQSVVSKYSEALKRMDRVSQTTLPVNDSCMAIFWYKKGVLIFRSNPNKRDYYGTIEAYKKALSFQRKYASMEDAQTIRLIYNIGSNYYRLRKESLQDSVFRYLDWALTLNENRKAMGISFTSRYPSIIQTLGRYYRRIGDIDIAKKYLEASIIHEKRARHKGIIYNDLSALYSGSFEDPDIAISYGLKALKVYSLATVRRSDSIDVYTNLSMAYAKAARKRKGMAKLAYSDTAYQYCLNVLSLNRTHKKILNNIGIILLDQGKYQQALDTLRMVSEENRKYGAFGNLALNLYGIGFTKDKLGNREGALEAYSEALEYYFSNFRSKDIFGLPDVEDYTYLDNNYALTTIQSKADLLLDMYVTDKEGEEYLEAAYETYAFLDKLIEKIRKGFIADASKFSLSERSKPIYEAAIQSCVLMSELKEEDSYKEVAFYYSEKSKALSLLESMRAMQAAHQGISRDEKDSLFKLIRIKENIERKLALAKLQGAKKKIIEKYQGEIPLHRNRLEKYLNWLEANRASYYQMKFGGAIASVEEVRGNLLESDQAMIAYFLGATSRYAFIIENNDLRIESLDVEADLFDWTQKLHSGMRDYYEDSLNTRSFSDLRTEYTSTAYSLYKTLIKPLGELPERLVIVPDEYLLYLPFDIFLTAKVENVQNFYSYPYLIKDKILSYGFSATLLKEIDDKRDYRMTSTCWTGFAPAFTEGLYPEYKRTRDLIPLPSSLDEVDFLNKNLNGVAYNELDANFDNLINAFRNSEIVHVSTHSFVNDEEVKNEDLYLVHFSLWDTTLFASDIHTHNILTKLLVLNSCKANMGVLRKGEGMASLNRAFVSAGTQSIVTTFWEVRDGKSWNLLLTFYKEILAGTPVDIALTKAKRESINQSDPYFWAAYVLYGDVTPISSPYIWLVILVILIITGIIGIFGVIFLIKRKSAQALFVQRMSKQLQPE